MSSAICLQLADVTVRFQSVGGGLDESYKTERIKEDLKLYFALHTVL